MVPIFLPFRSASVAIPAERLATMRYRPSDTVMMIRSSGWSMDARNACVSALVATSAVPAAYSSLVEATPNRLGMPPLLNTTGAPNRSRSTASSTGASSMVERLPYTWSGCWANAADTGNSRQHSTSTSTSTMVRGVFSLCKGRMVQLNISSTSSVYWYLFIDLLKKCTPGLAGLYVTGRTPRPAAHRATRSPARGRPGHR